MTFIVKFGYKSSTNIRFEIAAIPLTPHCLEVGDDVLAAGNGLIPNDPVKIITDLDKINGFLFNEKRISHGREVEKGGIISGHRKHQSGREYFFFKEKDQTLNFQAP